MKRMRDELSELRQEEIELEQKVDTSRHQVVQLDKRLADTQSQISQVLLMWILLCSLTSEFKNYFLLFWLAASHCFLLDDEALKLFATLEHTNFAQWYKNNQNRIVWSGLLKFYDLSFHAVQVKLNIQNLRDTQKTLTQSVDQYSGALRSDEMTEDQLKAASSAASDFQLVKWLNVKLYIL